jgi:hypothetical protein
MHTNKDIEEKIEQALNSMDHHSRATPRPYLSTRINAALFSVRKTNAWDAFYALITRPAVAMAGMAIIILLNVMILAFNKNSGSVKFQADTYTTEWQGYSTVASSPLYDLENMEP